MQDGDKLTGARLAARASGGKRRQKPKRPSNTGFPRARGLAWWCSSVAAVRQPARACRPTKRARAISLIVIRCSLDVQDPVDRCDLRSVAGRVAGVEDLMSRSKHDGWSQ